MSRLNQKLVIIYNEFSSYQESSQINAKHILLQHGQRRENKTSGIIFHLNCCLCSKKNCSQQKGHSTTVKFSDSTIRFSDFLSILHPFNNDCRVVVCIKQAFHRIVVQSVLELYVVYTYSNS